MLNKGMRPEEALELAKSDVHLERAKLSARKKRQPHGDARLDRQKAARSRATHGRRIPVDLPLAVQGGRHIVRLNNAHDAVCETTGLAFVLYDLRQHVRDQNGRNWCGPGDSGRDPRPQFHPDRAALRASHC
jgi:hypothetical protein